MPQKFSIKELNYSSILQNIVLRFITNNSILTEKSLDHTWVDILEYRHLNSPLQAFDT